MPLVRSQNLLEPVAAQGSKGFARLRSGLHSGLDGLVESRRLHSCRFTAAVAKVARSPDMAESELIAELRSEPGAPY